MKAKPKAKRSKAKTAKRTKSLPVRGKKAAAAKGGWFVPFVPFVPSGNLESSLLNKADQTQAHNQQKIG